VEFNFIGPYDKSNLSKSNTFSKEIDHLKLYSNTFFHGPLKQEFLIDQLFHMDIFLNLYREDENPASKANPHKMLEFLSTGKTVLSYYMEEYEDKQNLLVMTKNKKEIPQLFNTIIKNIDTYNNPKKMQRRRNYALQNSYEKKIMQIDSLLSI
jgi:hypothetical protein